MSTRLFLFVSVLALAACGDDEGTTATDSSVDAASIVDASVDASPQPDAAGDAGELPGLVLSGVTSAVSIENPGSTLGGVTVSVHDAPEYGSTVSDAEGNYNFRVPTGTQRIVFEKDGYWAMLYTENYSDDTVAGTLDAELVSDEIVTTVATDTESTISEDKGIVFINYFEPLSSGKMADISQSYNGSFVFGPEGAVTGDTTLEGGDDFVAFYGVELGTTTVTLADMCNSFFVDGPVRAKTFTYVLATCSN